MLCVFHAIVMKYHDTVYGKLPKQKGTRLLTEATDLYGNHVPANVVIRYLHLSTQTLFVVDCCSGDIVFQWFMKMSKACCTPAEYSCYHAELSVFLKLPETQKAPGKECIDAINKMKLSLQDKEKS